jgi:stage II sporulation protein M
MNFFSYYKQLFSANKHWNQVVLKWFVMGALIGAFVFFWKPDLLSGILNVFEDKFGSQPSLGFDLAIQIFLNNLQVSALALFGGLLLGFGPFLVVVSNGFILGYIITAIVLFSNESLTSSVGAVLVGIVPHGILEIPAFLLAAAFGLKLGIDWLRKDAAGKRGAVFIHSLKQVCYAIPAIVVILFAAAMVEVYVSGFLLNALTH